MNTKTLAELKDQYFGPIGTPLREEYEAVAQKFVLKKIRKHGQADFKPAVSSTPAKSAGE
jgi:hypothetical protein